jgi:hypothetical protein
MKREKTISIGEYDKAREYETIRKRIHIEETDDESTIMSGIEHIEEEIEMKEQEQIKSDASFYDKCKAYLDSFDFKGENYYSIKEITQREVIKNSLSLEESIDSVFATNVDEHLAQENKEESLKAIVASMYLVYTDLQQVLVIDYDYHQLLSVTMKHRFGVEISGEVIDFLEHYGE